MKTILVVDDEYAIIEALRALLEDEGYRVISASNGAEALALLETERLPDLILLDVMMPTLDGRETLQRLRENVHWAKIPVVLMSAALKPIDQAQRKSVTIMRKPFDLDLLLRTIDKLVS